MSKKGEKKKKRIKHERVYTAGVSEKEIKQIKYENEKDQLKNDLETSVEFGRKILLQNQKLNKQAHEKEEEKLAIQKELAYVKNLNEDLEDRLRDIKSNKMVDIFEREQILEKIKLFKQIKEERDQLAENNAQLRKKYEVRTQKYRKLQYEKRELDEKIEFLTDLLEQMKEKHEKTKKLQEQLNEMTLKYEKLQKESEEESQLNKHKIKKLQRKNQQILRNFDLKLEIIKNELSMKVMNMRLSKNNLKKTFIREMKKTKEEVESLFGDLLIKFDEILRKNKTRVIVKEVQIEKVVEHKIIEKQVEVKEDINEKMLLVWLRKWAKVKIDKFITSAFKSGEVFLKLIKRYKRSLITKDIEKGSALCGYCIKIFTEEFGVKELLDENISNEKLIIKYVYSIFLAFKKEFDLQKKLLKSKIMEFNYDVDNAAKMRVKSEKDYKRLQKKKALLLTSLNKININMVNVTQFFLKNEQLLSFIKEFDINKKMLNLNEKLLANRDKVSLTVDDDDATTDENTILIEDFNDLSKDYFKWSKDIQKRFLETKSEANIKEQNIYPDFEDSVDIINEKNKQLKINGKMVNKIWGIFGELSSKCNMDDESVKRGLMFNKDEIELENDIITYSLKGIMTTKVKNVYKNRK